MVTNITWSIVINSHGGINVINIFFSFFNFQSIGRWQKLWLAAGVIHFVGVIVYVIFASGHVQPWDPTASAEAQFVINASRQGEEGMGEGEGGGGGGWKGTVISGASLSSSYNERDPLLINPADADSKERETWERSLEDSLMLD
jgi:hypothetical protein